MKSKMSLLLVVVSVLCVGCYSSIAGEVGNGGGGNGFISQTNVCEGGGASGIVAAFDGGTSTQGGASGS